jgi:hypothetical protein
MHAAQEMVAEMQAVLGCRVEGFPQTYLGLPLSSNKLALVHFAPLIAKIDKYLSGWCAILLSSGGRLVLLNAVLDALPANAMGVQYSMYPIGTLNHNLKCYLPILNPLST